MQELDPRSPVSAQNRPGADRARDPEADGAADERAEHARDGRLAQPALEEHDEAGQHERERDVDGNAERERMEDGRGVSDDGDEQDAGERKPGHGDPRV